MHNSPDICNTSEILSTIEDRLNLAYLRIRTPCDQPAPVAVVVAAAAAAIARDPAASKLSDAFGRYM